jgi:peptidyl-tRNA hydrolase, PTH1 family
MTIVYGLGNNDPKYLNTKHNMGRLVVESIGSKLGLSFDYFKAKTASKSCFICKLPVAISLKLTNGQKPITSSLNDPIYLIYSNGYMNLSGEPLLEVVNFYKPTDFKLIIIHDESDIIEGKYKITTGGRSGGHNGINSIYNSFKDIQSQVIRVKCGIRPTYQDEQGEVQLSKQKALEFVLKPLSIKDKELIKEIILLV